MKGKIYLLFLFIFLIPFSLSQIPSNPLPENLANKINVFTLNFTNFTGNTPIEDLYINPTGTKLYVSNKTNIMVFNMTTPYLFSSVNLSSGAGYESYSLGLTDHNVITFGVLGTHFYTSDYSGLVSHFVLSTPFDLSTAVFGDSATLTSGVCTGGGVTNRLTDLQIESLGSLIYIASACNQTTTPNSGSAIQEYTMTTPYYVGTNSLRKSIPQGFTGGATQLNDVTLSFHLNTFFSFYYFRNGFTSGGTNTTYNGMYPYNLNSALTNKSTGLTLTDFQIASTFERGYYNPLNTNTIIELVIPPIIIGDIQDIELGLDSSTTINFNNEPFLNSNDIEIQIDDGIGNIYVMNKGDNNLTGFANFTYDSSGIFTIDSFNSTHIFTAQAIKCVNNTDICASDSFIISILNLSADISQIQEITDFTLSVDETKSINYLFYFDGYNTTFTSLRQQGGTTEYSFSDLGGSASFFNTDGFLVLNASHTSTNTVTFTGHNLSGTFIATFNACDSSFANCIEQEVTITTSNIVSGGSGQAINEVLNNFGGLFPSSSSLSFGIRALYIVFTMIIALVLILIIAYFMGDSGINRDIKTPLMWIALIVEILILVYFVSIDYIPIGLVVSGGLLMLMFVLLGMWRSR